MLEVDVETSSITCCHVFHLTGVMCIAATKLVICQLLAVCVFGWIQDRSITEAIRLGTTLFDHFACWQRDTALVAYFSAQFYAVLLLCIIFSLFKFLCMCMLVIPNDVEWVM